MHRSILGCCAAAFLVIACAKGGSPLTGGAPPDAGPDAGVPDAGQMPGGQPDGGPSDGGQPDSGNGDSGTPPDSGTVPDGGASDSGTPDSGVGAAPDAGACWYTPVSISARAIRPTAFS